MKVPFKQNMPNWAKSSYNELRTKLGYKHLPALDSETPPTQDTAELKGSATDPNIDRSFGIHSQARGALRYYKDEVDESERDLAKDDPGKIELENGESIWVNGTPDNGEFLRTRDNLVSLTVLKDGESESFLIVKDTHVSGQKIDLSDRDGNHEYSEVLGETSRREDLSRTVHAEATTNGAELLRSTSGTKSSLFHDIFLTGEQSMVDVRQDFLTDFQTGASKLEEPVQAELSKILKNKSAATPRQLHAFFSSQSKAYDDPKLAELREKASLWQALEDFPKLIADGIARTSEHYVAPQTLKLMTASQDWEFDQKTGLPIADSVVIGAGPGGLATGYHLSEQGARTIILEGGNVGQSFSDASAKSVHQLRTDEESTDLIYFPTHRALGVDVSMERQGHWNQKESAEAHKDWAEAQGETPHGVTYSSYSTINAVRRSELFQHMNQLAHGLSTRYPDTFVIEKSPVSTLKKEQRGDETLVRVKTANGHEVLARSLVVSTGFVGTHGQNARSLKQFENLEESTDGQVTVVSNDHDLISKNENLKESRLVFSDRLLGRPEMRERVKMLPPGSRIGVVGGGESAAKGALELAHMNPKIVVDIYASKPMEPYQTQVPANVIAPAVVESAIKDPRIAERTFEEMEDFGTPVTIETQRELLELEAQGRVRIRELGKRFTEETVSVKNSDQGFQLEIRDASVKRNLRQQREEWAELGFYAGLDDVGPPDELPNTDLMMISTGYNMKNAQAGPLIKQLVAEGLLELEDGRPVLGADGMSGAKNSMITFNTAAVASQAADTTLQARSIKGLRLAQTLGKQLPEREAPASTIDKELQWGEIPTGDDAPTIVYPERAVQVLDNEGYEDNLIEFYNDRVTKAETEQEKRAALNGLEARLSFPGQNHILRGFVHRKDAYPQTFNAAESLLLERGYELSERVHPHEAEESYSSAKSTDAPPG